MANTDVQRILFQHQGLSICRFRCPTGHRRWQRENQIVDGHNVAFPEVPVEIRHRGLAATLADPNVAVLYNDGDVYQRRSLHPAGDVSNVFLFGAEYLLAALARFDPAAEPEQPLSHRVGPVHARTFLKQRLLVARCARDPEPDEDSVLETALEILEEVVTTAYAAPRIPARRSDRSRAQVEAVQELLSGRHEDSLSLAEVAAEVDASVFHLCRTFKRYTGQTIHGYRRSLRLREGLFRLEKTETHLADLALDLGFSHQSHFTEAFRREFGTTPGRVDRAFRPRRGSNSGAHRRVNLRHLPS
ncbi:MAG: AraC family transcriptional regulator [Thermoanaerobaculia bacterium]|nr:AraC family transcriptional regulator [Thermoanaerobaculia bacterium]